MKIEAAWLDYITADPERAFVSDVFASDLDSRTLQLTEVPLQITLSPASNRWISATACLYSTSREDVIERCIQLGQFIADICPWVNQPGVHFVEAVLNSSRLRSRAASCREKCSLLSAQLRHLLGCPASKTDELAPADSPAQTNDQKDSDALYHARPLDRISEALSSLSRNAPEIGLGEQETAPVECQFVVAGELVYHLYSTALKRKEDPQVILRHFIAAARYLDANFCDLKVPSLPEQLLLKALQARKLALELNRILAGLETSLVDWTHVQNRFLELAAYRASRRSLKS